MRILLSWPAADPGQIVVAGDQSAGKSSVLESLTGFHFPRAVNLCTRHATEIICRREREQSVVVSIVPHDPSPEKLEAAEEFRREIKSLDEDAVKDVFADVRASLARAGQKPVCIEFQGMLTDH